MPTSDDSLFMKAVVFHSAGKVSVDNVLDPEIEHAEDIILRSQRLPSAAPVSSASAGCQDTAKSRILINTVPKEDFWMRKAAGSLAIQTFTAATRVARQNTSACPMQTSDPAK
jgi:hypothetical protein